MSRADLGLGGPGRIAGSRRGATRMARGIHGDLMGEFLGPGFGMSPACRRRGLLGFTIQSPCSFAMQSVFVKGRTEEDMPLIRHGVGRKVCVTAWTSAVRRPGIARRAIRLVECTPGFGYDWDREPGHRPAARHAARTLAPGQQRSLGIRRHQPRTNG